MNYSNSIVYPKQYAMFWTSTTYNDGSIPYSYDFMITNDEAWLYRYGSSSYDYAWYWGNGLSVRCLRNEIPVVYTYSATNILATTATCSGYVQSDGGERETVHGMCWSTSPNPTIADSITIDGTGMGHFISYLTGLTPNTTYYIRAYATNSVGTAYGEEWTFTTPCGIVDVTISGDSVLCQVEEITLTASGASSYRWDNDEETESITVTPTATTTYTVTGTDQYNCSGTTSFTVEVSGLTPLVSTSQVSGIATTSATCGGNVFCIGVAAVTARGVCWSTSPDPTIADSITLDGDGTGIFTSNLSGLTPNTTYYVRAYATNSEGTSYGNTMSFTTLCNNLEVSITGNTDICYGSSTVLHASGTESYLWSNGETNDSITATAHTSTLFLLQESFDNGEIPSGWQTIDQDGDGYNWDAAYPFLNNFDAHSGMSCISSASYINNALYPDNWLITPSLTIPSYAVQPTLSWWAKGQYTQWAAEHYAVYVSLNDQDWIPVYEEESTAEYVQRTVDLSVYAGQTIQIAFRHYNITNMYWLNLDDIEVYYTLNNTYIVTGTDEYGCSVTSSVTLTILDAPILGVSEVGTLCVGETTTLNATGADTYIWSNGDEGANISVTPDAETTYSVTGTNAYGCSSTASVTVYTYILPGITTDNPSDITLTSATCGGEITCAGNSAVTARGVCWSTSPNPTIADSITTNGTGIGSFTSSLTGLTPNTNYYVRAYATNSEGTAYGEEVTFHTPADRRMVDYALLGFSDGSNLITEINLDVNEDLYPIIYIQNNGPDVTAATDTVYIDITINNQGLASLFILGSQLAFMSAGQGTTASGADPIITASNMAAWELGSTFEMCFSIRIEGEAIDPDASNNTACITVNRAIPCEAMSITISGNDTLCAGESAVLTAAGAESYLWNTDDTVASITVTPAATTTYTVTGTNQYGCSATDSITVTVHALPVVSVSGDTTITEGSNATLSVTDDPQWNYLWSTGDTIASITVSPDETTTYSVTVTNGLCETTDSVTITVTTGISQYQKTDIRIYPNPTTGIVNVVLGMENGWQNGGIQVFDMYGRMLGVVNPSDARGASPQTVEIDLSRYPTGMYLLKVVNDGKVTAIGKVVKE